MTNNLGDESLKAALKIFGDMLRRQRQASQWTFHSLAEKSGVDETIISQLEAGENVGTEIDREALCEFLGIDIDTFPRVLRTQQAQSETSPTLLGREPTTSNVVNLQGYRDKWPKTTTHPEG
ncbi:MULTISPECIES: helix-turn-helix domain-containing protein [Rhizobium]|uniref:helix-turn-helix domain-containing protein n=1 Tax=Rhizobium TaxID=379 RepID=UPI001C8FDB5C|nr:MULTISPECIES: helix-turn-helix transcriptional regulator [Rhizobium]MBY2987010.1 helix-turn-helix domain-containing protein [Rhizobium leguminosarum]MBY3049140.1 helix-turn-helix domain-containing protein [Rhizobium laguerreae]WSH22694.1 helix-turn-helix transcriptional regulator [Rhizobium ruizarguesonis]WSH35634.1 helix-turn-helix transcriptional regulator [Rhizobium ruizarguesonis]